MKNRKFTVAVLVLVLVVVNLVLYKVARQKRNNPVKFNKKTSVFTGKVQRIQAVVLDTDNGSYNTRLVSTEGNDDRFSIPSKMALVVGQSYKFTVKNDLRPGTYPSAVEAIKK